MSEFKRLLHEGHKPKNWGARVNNLEELEKAVDQRRAVICFLGYMSHRPQPAAWMMNLNGALLLSLFRVGMYIYIKPTKKPKELLDADDKETTHKEKENSEEDNQADPIPHPG